MNAITTVTMSTDELGQQIRARIQQGDKAAGKAEDHYLAAGLHLKEARDQIAKEGGKFDEFLEKHKIGRSRAYEFLAVADGKKTFAGIRAKNAERAARHAEKNRVARESVSNGLIDATNPPPADPKAAEEIILLLVEHVPDDRLPAIADLLERADMKAVVVGLRGLAAKPADNDDIPDFIPAFLARGAA